MKKSRIALNRDTHIELLVTGACSVRVSLVSGPMVVGADVDSGTVRFMLAGSLEAAADQADEDAGEAA